MYSLRHLMSALLLAKGLARPESVSLAVSPPFTAACEAACTALEAMFGPSLLHYPDNDPAFSIWDGKQAEAIYACRVEPENSQDVSKVLSILVDKWCTFAVKGGGHSRAVDASNSVGGVTIDMNRINTTQLSADRQSAWLGAGLTLLPSFRAIEAEGLSFVGGRVDSVGVAGFTMGGGFSNLSPKLGLAVDNILEMELVLPNATVVNVTCETHPELFFALRGGANNFGIVVNFRLVVVPEGPQLFGQRTYAPQYIDRVLQETHKLATDYANDTDVAFYTRYDYEQASTQMTPSVFLAYLQPEAAPPTLKDVMDIPFESSTLSVDWMSNHIDDPVVFGERYLFTTLTYTASAEIERRTWEIFKDEVESLPEISGFTAGIVTQPITANAFKAAKERGGSALGLETPTGGPLYLSLLTFGWSNKSDDSSMYQFAENWRARSANAADEMGFLNRFLYINYCKEDQDPFAGYGENNQERLRRIQRENDAGGVFRADGLNRGYFKLN